MPDIYTLDERLVQQLPLPLAQLCRRAHNAKTPLERHQAAYYLWEASLKLLASVAVVAYADLSDHDPDLAERLKNLARPSLGHWWEFVRRLVPVLADGGDAGFAAVRELVLGRAREDMPRAAGLDAALLEALEGRGGARSTVRLTELFDRLVQYRNREIGHGAAGQRTAEFYERMSRVLLAGAAQVLGQVDVLAGRRLLYVGEVRRQASGNWLVERYTLSGESPKRIESLELPEAETARLPRPEQTYLEVAAGAPGAAAASGLRALHPLLYFEASSGLVYFLNSRHGKRGIEYLSYESGDTLRREELGAEHRQLLAGVLRQPVAAVEAEAWAAAGMADEPGGANTSAEPVGRHIGEFELLSRLGQGGMGVVYRAWQPSLGRQVALKCMLRAGDPKAEARFSREIHALGRVEHVNVVKVFTSGSEGDQWFYAMELIEGAELSRVCAQLAGSSATEIDEGNWRRALTTACEQARSQETALPGSQADAVKKAVPPSGTASVSPPQSAVPMSGRGHVKQVVEVLRQVADAAHALHEAGVVHRDIKPGNIMLTMDGAHPVLMDLGLAQLADETDGRVTRTRQFVGTLRYASPEQVLAAGRVDRRTDVYSLGATLWELLTLGPIFGVTDDTPTPDLMLKIQTSDPESPRKYNRHVPRDLEAIVLKCLEKDRARRYQTAADLSQDLGRFLSGEPVAAQPPSMGYLASKFVRRYRTPLAAAAAVLLLALVGTVVAFVRISKERNDAVEAQGREQKEKEKAEKALADLNKSRKEAEVVWQVVDQAYSSVGDDNIRHLPGLSAVQEELAGIRLKGYQRLVELTPDDPNVKPRLARGHAILGVINGIVGRLERSTTNLSKAAKLYEELEQQHPDDPTYRLARCRALFELGYAYYSAGLNAQARPPLEQAIALVEKSLKRTPDDARLRFELAQASLRLGALLPFRSEKARKIALCVRARDLYDGLVREKHRLADALAGRALATENQFSFSPQWNDAKVHADTLKTAQADYAAALLAAPNSPFIVYFTCSSLLDAGDLVGRTGSAANARAHFDKAVALMRQSVKKTPEAGRYTAMLARCLGKLAKNAELLGKLTEARAAMEESCQLLAALVQRFDDRPEYARLLVEQRNQFATFVNDAKLIADPTARTQAQLNALEQAVTDGRKTSARYPDHPLVNAAFAKALHDRAQFEVNAGRHETAANLTAELMDVYRARVMPNEPPGARASEILQNLQDLLDAFTKTNRDADLLKLSQLAFDLAPHADREGKDAACRLLLASAPIHKKANRLEEAIKIDKQVLGIAVPAVEKDPWHWWLRSRIYAASNHLADIYRERKDSRNEVLCLRELLRYHYEPLTSMPAKKFLAPGRPDDAAEADTIRDEMKRLSGGMKRFTVPCDFNGVKYPFNIYVTDVKWPKHPIEDQARWLLEVRGGVVPAEVMDAFARLHKIAYENNVSFGDLCVYALGTAAVDAHNVPSGQPVVVKNFGEATPAAPQVEAAQLARLKARAADLKTQQENAVANPKLLIALIQAYVDLGDAYLTVKQPAEAVLTFENSSRALEKALAAAPKGQTATELLARTLRGLSRGYEQRHELDKAVVVLLRFLEMAEQHYWKSFATSSTQPGSKAPRLNWAAERINAMIAMGDLFQTRKEPLEAVHWYQKAIDLRDDAAARKLAALVLANPSLLEAIPEQSRDLLQQARKLESVNLNAIPDRFVSLLKGARAARAKQTQDAVAKTQALGAARLGRMADQYHRLAEEYRKQDKLDDAVARLRDEVDLREQQLKMLPTDAKVKAGAADAAYQLATLCAARKRDKEAVKWMWLAVNRAHEQAAFDWADWLENGRFMKKQPDQAKHWKAIAHNHRGNRHFREAKYAEALVDYKVEVDAEPQAVVGFQNLGATYGKLGQWKEAVAAYRISHLLAPTDYPIVLNLLEAFVVAGQPKELLEFAASLDKKGWSPSPPYTAATAKRLALFNGLQAIALRLTSEDAEPEPEKKLFEMSAVPGFKVDIWNWTEIDGWLAKADVPGGKKAAVRRILEEMKGNPQERTTPFYPLHVGAKWVYDATTTTGTGYKGAYVIRVTAREKINETECYKLERGISASGTQTEHVVVRYDGVYRVAEGGKALPTPYRLLALPAERGKTWTTTKGVEQHRSGVLLGSVDTPAGKFEDVRVVQTDVTEKGADRLEKRVWYAENVGPVKMETPVLSSPGNNTILTLKKYYPPEKAK
jgi:serine/threonine protein kinase